MVMQSNVWHGALQVKNSLFISLSTPYQYRKKALWSSLKGKYSKSSTPFCKYCAMEHSIHLQKKNNMEFLNHSWFKHSILIDKCCLMEFSFIKERTLHYGVLNRMDDFKNSIGFDKSCSMEFFEGKLFEELHAFY